VIAAPSSKFMRLTGNNTDSVLVTDLCSGFCYILYLIHIDCKLITLPLWRQVHVFNVLNSRRRRPATSHNAASPTTDRADPVAFRETGEGMAVFLQRYVVLFEDTMAYGSHHFLTNLKFQTRARETLFFEHVFRFSETAAQEFAGIVLLTQEGYCRNIAPATVGERLAVLLTFEEPTRSSLRMCFRVMRENGDPVSCGFQTLVFTSRTGSLVPFPPALEAFATRHFDLIDPLPAPGFAARVLTGGAELRTIFNSAMRALAARVADPQAASGIVLDVPRAAPAARDAPIGRVLMAPGQGSYSRDLLRRLLSGADGEAIANEARALVAAADIAAREVLGASFTALLEAPTRAAHDVLLAGAPDLDQFGIFAGAFLRGRGIDASAPAGAFLGHSFGEVAALALAGAYDAATGVRIVAERVRALRLGAGAQAGGMLALGAGRGAVAAVLPELNEPEIAIAVANHARQTVLSGPADRLDPVAAAFAARGIPATRLSGRYAFHSPMLSEAARRFLRALQGLSISAPRRPVFSPILGRFYGPEDNVAVALASHFIRPVEFEAAIETLAGLGADTFVEAGAGRVLTNVIGRIAASRPELGLASVPVPGSTAPPGVPKGPAQGAAPAAASPGGLTASAPVNAPSADGGPAVTADSPIGSGGTQLPRPIRPSPPPALASLALAPPASQAALHGADEPRPDPADLIAIVALGAVTPGAADVDALWRNVLHGTCGVGRFGEVDPHADADFGGGSANAPAADKTYSMLLGLVRDTPRRADCPFGAGEFAALTKPERMLATALGECLAGLATRPARVRCVLGATTDGSAEYDEALFLRGVQDDLPHLALTDTQRAALQPALAALFPPDKDPESIGLFAGTQRVLARFLGDGASPLLIDAACASSLYAIEVAARLLRDGACDLALAGGVYAPGPANSALFARFGGLSANGSFPFDERADGAVFGEAAAVVALRRLPDALAAGETVLAVVRAVGLSSDGRSPSVNVPQPAGQALAMRRAYATAGLEPWTVQAIDAHATATVIGDATEGASLRDVFGARPDGVPPVSLTSLKSILGHTGWVAGVASVVMLCRALATHTLPPQRLLQKTNPSIGLDRLPFHIPPASLPWPGNAGGRPRRAAANSFGFGGSNAHIVLDAYEPAYHGAPSPAAVAMPRARHRLAVLGLGSLFADPAGGLTSRPGRPAPVTRKALRPPRRRLMPDVLEHMDVRQYLALSAAEDACAPLAAVPADFWRDAAVVIGATGKTRRAMAANERVFAGRLRRRLAGVAPETADALVEALRRRNPPTNPYTLIGAMPNIVSGRVANGLNLNGPNFVVDAGPASLEEALATAEALLAGGACRVALVGAVNATGDWPLRPDGAPPPLPDGAPADGICLLAVMPETEARAAGLAPLVFLGWTEDGALRIDPVADPTAPRMVPIPSASRLDMVAGLAPLAEALHAGRADGCSAVLVPARTGDAEREAARFSTERMVHARPESAQRGHAGIPAAAAEAGTEAGSVTEPDLGLAAPTLVPTPLPPARPSLAPLAGRVLLVADDASRTAWATIARRGGTTMVLAPGLADEAGAGGASAAEASAAAALQAIDPDGIDLILLLRDLGATDAATFLADGAEDEALLETLFLAARHCAARLATGKAALGILAHGAVREGRRHPAAGLHAGFVKALAREFPRATIKAVASDEPALPLAAFQLAREMACRGRNPGDRPPAPAGTQPAPVPGTGPLSGTEPLCGTEPLSDTEVVWCGGRRHVLRLAPVARPGPTPALPAGAVLVATGGGRGITAEMALELAGRSGATAVLLGSTDPAVIPDELAALDEETFAAREPVFYRAETARNPAARPADLRRRWAGFRAARAVQATLARFAARGLCARYMAADITDPAAVHAAIAAIKQSFGRIDLILHGAGVQYSKRLTRRSLADWRATLATKLGGLRNLVAALDVHAPEDRPAFHLISSTYSFAGNDGQPDYGAANEALALLAATLDRRPHGGPAWTALGWIGWAETGMAGGPEYRALARERGLDGIASAKGAALFADVAAAPPAPALYVTSPDVLRHFGLALASRQTDVTNVTTDTGARAGPRSWTLSDAPYLRHHLVAGQPTLPGAVSADLALQAARDLYPNLRFATLRNVMFRRFVRVAEGRHLVLRTRMETVSATDSAAAVRVALVSDFHHPSGRLLLPDVVYLDGEITLTAADPRPGGAAAMGPDPDGVPTDDPYVSADGPVALGGPFNCLFGIRVGPSCRTAIYHPAPGIHARDDGFATDWMLVDALFRLACIPLPSAAARLFVPHRLGALKLAARDPAAVPAAPVPLRLVAANPVFDDTTVRGAWAEAIDAAGRVVIRMEHTLGHVMAGAHVPA